MTVYSATYLDRLMALFARASGVSYDNTTSGLAATDVQGAIDEVAGGSGGPVAAEDVTYDNGATGLPAANVQAAIDFLFAYTKSVNLSALSGTLTIDTRVTVLTLDESGSTNISCPYSGVFHLVVQNTGAFTIDFGSIATPGGVPYVATTGSPVRDILEITSLGGSFFVTVIGQDYATL
jgi:hypothetical protein